MVFTKNEILKISESLRKNNDILSLLIKSKIDELLGTTVNGNFSIRNTDWCVENGRKNRGRKNKICTNDYIID